MFENNFLYIDIDVHGPRTGAFTLGGSIWSFGASYFLAVSEKKMLENHVHSPGARTDNPMGSKFFNKH